jgi:hypothetical protein
MSLRADYDLVEAALADLEAESSWGLPDTREALERIWDALEGTGLIRYEPTDSKGTVPPD